jgi:hypothetical protein
MMLFFTFRSQHASKEIEDFVDYGAEAKRLRQQQLAQQLQYISQQPVSVPPSQPPTQVLLFHLFF